MHANNEIGNLLDIDVVGNLCKSHNAIFHSDCVQTVGHYPMDLRKTPAHFISGAGHKFHGPKGIGILYVNDNIKIKPFILGGGQERNLRAGTENLYGIVGFGKALELAMTNYETDSKYKSLKTYDSTTGENIKAVQFNGETARKMFIHCISAAFPQKIRNDTDESCYEQYLCLRRQRLQQRGRYGSHVIRAINNNQLSNGSIFLL
jgi:cysteine desulfurase